MNSPRGKSWNEHALECAEKCLACSVGCWETYERLVGVQGVREHLPHALPLLECVEISRTTASFVRWDSDFWASACLLCAAVCDQCARECQQMVDDEQIIICGKTCEACADACRALVEEELSSAAKAQYARVSTAAN